MNRLFITNEDLKKLVVNLKKDCDEFMAPKREHLDDVIFCDTKDDGREILNYEGNSLVSPRAFLLPQTELLFEIKSVKKNALVPIEDDKRRIFYGVRPCDITAIQLMRSFFLDDVKDSFYELRLENSTFLALACTKCCHSKSFCHEMAVGPIAKEGFDMQFIPITGGFLVEVGTKKGGNIARKNKALMRKAAPKEENELKNLHKEFGKRDRPIDYKKLARLMKDEKVKESIWDDIGLRCVICSGCITVCPTCSCFSIADRISGDKGERLRYCDGCPYAGFTKMAGGSTPFQLHKDHIRRFFEHKLNVDVERYGRPSCVGCGRCIKTCPGNISIRKFIDDALEVAG